MKRVLLAAPRSFCAGVERGNLTVSSNAPFLARAQERYA